ncbi:MAG: SAM-dependent methyltransferase [Bacteroidetes bacterium]|nr:MAG: SAM-dependent methyltransferase [Bacteroidota bacterium]
MFRNRLVKVYRHLSKQARRQHISCYRLYDNDLPEFPFCIEFYGERICLSEYKRHFEMGDEAHHVWLEQCVSMIAEVVGLPAEAIFHRQRRRKAGRQDQYERLNERENFFVVEEAGLNFKVNLTDYLDTGLFLDHRITRRMVRDESKDKRVLNLFCYTGSFSVYAAAGGAASIVSVDMSKTYLDWAHANMRLNRFADAVFNHFEHADVLQYLRKIRPGSFDLIILDPPTFSNSKRMLDFFDVQRDHVQLLNDTLSALSADGILYFSTNFSKFMLDESKIKAASIKNITKATTPFDFQGKLSRFCFKISK